MGQMTQTVS